MIIGISGKANSGKDTLAHSLIWYRPWFEKKSFAYKLKQIAAILTGWEDQYTREGKAHYLPLWEMTVGEFQQKLGTNAIRCGLRDDAWIIALLIDYSDDNNWIVTDCRFPNEVIAIRERGGVLIRINRDIQDDCGRDMSHPSETALDNWQDWDFVVDNNGTLEDLEKSARAIVERIQDEHRV